LAVRVGTLEVQGHCRLFAFTVGIPGAGLSSFFRRGKKIIISFSSFLPQKKQVLSDSKLPHIFRLSLAKSLQNDLFFQAYLMFV
jgi:hypothetical protein